MEKKEILKKEISELEANARIARNKNLDARKDSSDIHKGKVSLIGEIATLEKEAVVERAKHKKLVDQRVKVEKDIKLQEKTIAEEYAEIKKERNKLNEFEQSLKDIDKGIVGRQASLKQDEKKFDAKKEVFNDEKITLAQAKEAFKNERLAFEKEREGIVKMGVDIKKRITKLTGDENGIIKKLDEVKELKIILDDERKKLANVKIEQDKVGQKLNTEVKRLEEDEAKFAVRVEEMGEKEKKLEGRKKSLGRAYDELAIRKEEVEILELKVNKLIRDNNVGKELARLKKELGK